ncbi:anaerobic ribonucleoside-triphosphate reductase, partial [bacterium]|nr:anaerobic ribonucleoside-triphosphate reductase [bacterium]
RIAGGKDKRLAFKVAEKVEDYLRERYLLGETITVAAVHDAVKKVLVREKHTLTVRAYISSYNRKEEMRKRLRVAKKVKKMSSVTDLTLLVTAPSAEEMLPWDKEKIVEALIKEADLPLEAAYQVAREVEKKIFASELKQVSTGLIREMVDNELLSLRYDKQLKKQRTIGVPTFDLEQFIFSKSLENSNISAYNPEAVNLMIAETTLKQYALNNIFSREVADGHLEGKIHLHDLGYPVRVYCSSHSLEYLKKYGLQLENLDIISSPAKHARTLTGHLNTFLASMQAYYAGALGIAYINIFYAPYLVGMDDEQLKQEAQYLIFSLSQSAFSRGGQVLFLDANVHTGIPNYLKDVPAIGPGGEYTKKTYGEYEKEAQLFARALMDVWRGGDAYGHVFAFPKMDLHITEETFSDPKQRELLEHACQIASENGTPYFVFDRDEVTLSACCRLRTQIKDKYMIKHPESMRFCGFQNVTINLPQAAYRAGKGNIEKLFPEIEKAMDLAMKAHLEKKGFIAKLMSEKGLPLWQLGKQAADGRPYVDLEKATYIIGIIGLNECVQYLTGKQMHENEEVYKLGLKIISYMYLKTKEYEKRHNLKVSLEETPAESASRRLAKVDLREYPQSREVIAGDIDKDQFYYTNSIHFAADAPVSLVERISKQSKFHTMIESGAILHAFIGEDKPSPESILNLVEKTWKNTKAAQLTISPEFTVCQECQRVTRGLVEKCSHCQSPDVYGITRIVGYFSRVSNWNQSKLGELADRHSGDYRIT